MLISFILSFFLFYEINKNKDGVQNSVKLIPYDVSNLISLNFINSSNNIYCKKINDDWFINTTNDKLQKAHSLIIQRKRMIFRIVFYKEHIGFLKKIKSWLQYHLILHHLEVKLY